MTKHTNEELGNVSGMIYTVTGVSIARMDRGEPRTRPMERDANALHFVQIWNAWPKVLDLIGDLMLNRVYYQLSDEAIEQIKSVIDELPIESARGISIERR